MPLKIKRHPPSLHCFSIVHFFERFSYYGIKSLLLLYLATQLKFSDAKSYTVFGVYATLTYATSLLGGYVADKFIGFYAALWAELLFIMAGHASIFFTGTEIGFFLGLGLVATGSGLYKSNMNALIGNLYDKESLLKDSAYTIFFVYQNAGAFLAPIICGYIGLTAGWSYGFSLAAFGGLCALIVLSLSRRFKRQIHSEHSLTVNFQWQKLICLLVGGGCLASFLGFIIFYGEESLDLFLILSLLYCGIFFKYYVSLTGEDRKNMLIVFFGILAVAVSGALISHGAGVFTLFMSRNVDPSFLQFEVPVTFIQAVDPLTIVIFGPLFAILWKVLSKKGKYIPGMTKTLIGFGLIVVAYVYLLLLCSFSGENNLVSFVSFIMGLLILAASDILIYPNVLTFCSRFSPKELTGVVMGFVVFGMSLSQLFGTYFAKMAAIPGAFESISASASIGIYRSFFEKMALISLITLIVLSCLVYWINQKKNKNGY